MARRPARAFASKGAQPSTRGFFYAGESAEFYDLTAELLQPFWSSLHEAIVCLLRSHYSELREPAADGKPFFILDIGSGTGAEALRLIRAFPRTFVVGLDSSAKMHAALRSNFRRLFPRLRLRKRCLLVQGDVLGEAGEVQALLSHVPTKAYDAVVSGFVLHHFSPEEKRRIYRNVYGVLAPGGAFINADLFAFQSPTLSALADAFGYQWMKRQLTDPDPANREAFEALGDAAPQLRDRWLEHWRLANRPCPTEPSGVGGGRRSPGEADILAAAGFKEFGFPMRYWQAGVLWAKK